MRLPLMLILLTVLCVPADAELRLEARQLTHGPRLLFRRRRQVRYDIVKQQLVGEIERLCYQRRQRHAPVFLVKPVAAG